MISHNSNKCGYSNPTGHTQNRMKHEEQRLSYFEHHLIKGGLLYTGL